MKFKTINHFYRNVLLLGFLVTNMCFANKTHFSRWIKIDTEYPKNIYIFETILMKGLDHCIESCKTKAMCEYINFEVNANMCSLIGVEKNVSDDPDEKIEKKKGHVLGKKKDWNLDEYEVCKLCNHSGECNVDQKCQNSGCGPPREKENATIHGNMFFIGDKAEYKCQKGYKNMFNNTGIVTCQSSGTWSITNFKCVKDEWICHGNSCYFVDQTQRSWYEGKIHCNETGGFLADIKSQQENLFIIENVLNVYTSEMWIGGNDLQNERNWRWLDGTQFGDWTGWGQGEPGGFFLENCLLLWSDNMWHDANCYWRHKSLCKFNI
ncbi:macrophage mannose receptor 1-like isoform X1 [Ruditapes philippinarum]|uniref:macrophage mannose receptor 1-like isoform X1 n=1 Tax=Ruditapes philippinarum TaxID=129788 RepID=UPI00295AF89A|nr:macrophage mannose receptor 1-like isoform X1 [Ruditapes philippinarum]